MLPPCLPSGERRLADCGGTVMVAITWSFRKRSDSQRRRAQSNALPRAQGRGTMDTVVRADPRLLGSSANSPLRQAGQAQASDEEFENLRCRKLSALAQGGDGQFGVDGKRSAKFGARLIDMAEMRQRDDFDPHHCDHARL